MVVMGTVAAPYGIRGWVRIRPDTEDPAALLGYGIWWTRPPRGGQWLQRTLLTGRAHGGALVAQLDGVGDREAALALKGCEIGVSRTAMPATPPGEIYWSDLAGMAVVNRAGVLLGTVAGLVEHGAHPLLRVSRREGEAGPERLIPYVPVIVVGVDRAARRVEVDWGEDY